MSVLMEQHERWSAARARLWSAPRRDVRAVLAALPAPTRVTKEAAPWGCPLNLLGIPSPRFIIRLVALRRGVNHKEMTGSIRSRPMVAARDEALGLVWTHCRQMSLPELGRLFGGRDHTTILHSLRKMRLHGQNYYRRVIPTIHGSNRDVNETGLARP